MFFSYWCILSHMRCNGLGQFPLDYSLGNYILEISSVGEKHKVDRVLGFFSNRPNWDPLTPSPAGECALLPLKVTLLVGGGIDSLAGEGVGGPNSDNGTKTVVL
jgi:hypothetical protein